LYKKKYAKGEPITSLDELMKQDVVFWFNKVVPKGWFQNWQMRLAQSYVTYKHLFKAVKIKEADNENN